MAGVDRLDMKLSSEYVRIVLGMDRLYRNGQEARAEASLDREGLVPINLTVETPNDYTGWSNVLEDLRELRQRYVGIENEIRRNYMQQQIGSLIRLAEWCSGVEIPFREKVRCLLYVNENPFIKSERDALHQRLDHGLAGRGLHGTLLEKVRYWEEDRRVSAGELEGVLRDLLDEGKERVVRTMFSAMEDVMVEPQVVYGVPYNAYCDYVNGKMYINGDLSYTYEALKHLVAHESFPGHTTHMRIREIGVDSGDIPLDAGLVITNTASSSVFEGIGDNGIHFINWMSSPDDYVYEIYQQIRSIAGLNAAHMIHTEGKSDEEVSRFLAGFAFGHDNWIASRLRFFKHSLRAPFIYSYWRGNEAVRDIYQRVSRDDRRRFYEFLYKTMLSADTVKQFV